MMKVTAVNNGVVIDHITAGTGLALYHRRQMYEAVSVSGFRPR